MTDLLIDASVAIKWVVEHQLIQALESCPSYRRRPVSIAEIDPDLRRDDEEENASSLPDAQVISSTLTVAVCIN